MSQSYRFFSDHFTGSLVNRITSLQAGFQQLSDAVWWDIIPMVVSLVGAMVLLGMRAPIFVLILLVWIGVSLIAQTIISIHKLEFDTKRAITRTKLTGDTADVVTNSINVSLFTGSEYEEKRFDAIARDFVKYHRSAWRIAEHGTAFQNLMSFFCEVAVLALVVSYWQRGLMTVGDIVFVQGVLLVVFSNTNNLGRFLRRIYEAGADTHEMLDILDLVPEVRDVPRARVLKVTKGAIEFDHVAFAYRNGVDVLRNLSFSIPSKQKLALVGASGSGKTTISKLLFRFFDIQGGVIKIDGQDISKVTQDSLRDAIAYVPQEPILFHRSLLENIRYGRRTATDKEVVQAAKLAHCHDFIQNSPEGYETLVGERGIKLSGGERQRIAIARAILKDAPILVLDEATSSLDSESESFIQDALKKLMRNKTVIVIAHRLSTIMEMDRIIVMQDGKIVDEGTHDTLRDKVGIYQKLWSIQAGGFQE